MTLIDDPVGWLRRRLGRRAPSLDTLGFVLSGVPVMEQGRFEPVETALILRLLDRTDLFVNVGANIGYYVCHALARGRRAVAFEPVPKNLRLLQANVADNGWTDRMELHPVALAARPGTMRLYGGGTGASLVRGWAGQRGSRSVPVTTLDAALAGRFRDSAMLIVIDVEGAERGVLEGAAATLANPVRPVWFVEITVHEHQPRGVTVNPDLAATFGLFEAAGYAAWAVHETPRRVLPAEVAAVAATGRDTFGTHNFLFAMPDRAAALGLPD